MALKPQVPFLAGVLFVMAVACGSIAAGGHGPVQFAAADSTMTALGASAATPVSLGDAPVRVPLALAASRRATQQAIAGGRQVDLVLSGLKANQQPGITYRVYLGLAEGAVPDEAHFVQTINFFNNVPLDGAASKPDEPLRFDVTGLAAKVLAGGGDLAVTLVPDGKMQNGAQPLIGHIAIVAK